jgi:hypothetical protein
VAERQLRTWSRAREMEKVWAEGDHTEGWIPFGYQRLMCGCLVDTFTRNEMRRPCMAHEGDGHIAAISEQDGVHVARCLVAVCPWVESRAWENDAISAAQGHWRDTSAQTAVGAAGKN